MARLIDADALYEVVSEHVTTVSVCPTVDWARGKRQFQEICLEDIQNAPTVGGWISVKDRLPENAEDVLVFMERDAWGDGDEVVRKHEVGIGYQIAGRWHVDGCSRVIGLYWQYLPEPPKEDNDAGQ